MAVRPVSVTERAITRKRAKKGLWKTRLTAYAFLLPTFIFIIAFSYYPALRALVGSFTQWDGFNPPTWVGLQNFTEAFNDPIFLESLKNVGIWTIIGIPLAIIPSFVVAELIFHLKGVKAQYVYRTVFVLSMVLPAVVGILIWQFFYEPNGVLNLILQHIGMAQFRHAWIANPRYALPAVILMGFPWIAPFNLLIYYSGLQGIPSDIFDAVAVDGARRWQRIRLVDIPLVMPQTKLLLVLSIIGVTQNLLVPLIMTDGGPGSATTTPVFYMYQTAINYDQYGYGMAIGTMIFIVVMALTIINLKYFQARD